jgi:hypothetical protein
MPEIMISLVAVVLLILVIGFFAMRYLRADDSDPFEDLPGDRGRSRGGDAADHDWRGDDRAAPVAARSGRGGSSRGAADDGPSRRDRRGRGRGDREPARDDRQYAAADRPARFDDRGFDDRGFDDRNTGERSLGGASDRKGDRSARGGQRPAAASGQRGGSELPQVRRPAPASARPGRGGNAQGTDWDSMSDVDYWAEVASDKPLTTTAQPAAQARSSRDQDAQPDRRQDVSARSGRSAGAGRPDESTALLPRRRHSPTGPADSSPMPAAIAGRAAADGRDQAAARPGRSGQPARGSQGRDTGSGRTASRRSREAGGAYPDGRGLLASGPDSAVPSAEQGMAALARLGNASGNGSNGGGGRGASSNGNGGRGSSRPVPLDDDPLTSPSFPAVRASDSRSYRSGRPDTPSAGSRPPAASGTPAGYGAPAQPAPVYPAPAAAPDPRSGYGAQSGSGPLDRTGGYGQQPGSANGSGSGTDNYRPAPAAASYQDYSQPSQPVGNPYGSYVSPETESYPVPGAASPGHQGSDAGDGGGYLSGQETQQYSQPQARHLAPAPDPHLSMPVHAAPVYDSPLHTPAPTQPHPAQGAQAPMAGYGEGWYGTSAENAGGGYSSQAPAAGSYGNGDSGYAPVSHNGGQYDQPTYLPADSPGIPQDQHGYGTPDSGYGAEAYGGYPGY